MSTIFCSRCDYENPESEVYCAKCGKPVRSERMDFDQIPRVTQPFGALERNSIAICCALSLLLFFFPLLSIHAPIAGDQDVSGYDVFSQLNEFREKLKPSDLTSGSGPNTGSPVKPIPDLPLSIQLGWLIPLELILAFVSALFALIAAFTNPPFSRVVCIIGACLAVSAILHTTIMNLDTHSWLSESMKTARSNLKDNPFGGLAENLETLIVNSIQIKPGWGLYALALLLGLAAVIGYSRVLSRLRFVPISNS